MWGVGEERKEKHESFPLSEDEGWSHTLRTVCLMAFRLSLQQPQIDDRRVQRSTARGGA